MVGAPFAAVISDRYGRRKGMFAGAVVIILGMIIVSTASTVAQFVVGRFVLGFGIAIMTVAAPGYAIEIAPPHWRGRCAGKMNLARFHVARYTSCAGIYPVRYIPPEFRE